MDLNALQDLIDACTKHVLVMHDKVDDLKDDDPNAGKEELPEGYDTYVNGAYQMSILNLFSATQLLKEEIKKAIG